jgi:hypothetical protein
METMTSKKRIVAAQKAAKARWKKAQETVIRLNGCCMLFA